MAGPGLLTRRLTAAPLDAAAFAPFGRLIEASGPAEPINEGTTRRFPELARLALQGRDAVVGIYVAQARRLPLRLARLEQHRLAPQLFLPLGSHRFIVVVAPGDAAPDWRGLRAFVTEPGQGVMLRPRCWHHGLVALGDGDRFAVIEGADYRADTVEVDAPEAIELDASILRDQGWGGAPR